MKLIELSEQEQKEMQGGYWWFRIGNLYGRFYTESNKSLEEKYSYLLDGEES